MYDAVAFGNFSLARSATSADRHDLAAQIAALSILTDVGRDARALITAQSARMYRQGDYLLTQGQTQRAMFIVLHGTVEIRRWQSDQRRGTSFLVVTRDAGAVVGEQSFIEELPHSADVVALTDVVAIRIEPERARLLLNDAALTRNLLRLESAKLRAATEQRFKQRRDNDLLYATVRRHLSDEVASQIIATGTNVTEPRRTEIITLMADIRGFTAIAAALDPLDLARDLGNFLGRMADIIIAADGMVDKFIGDAIMGIWGFTPLLPTSPASALAVAETMVRAASGHTIGGYPVQIGVGLSFGEVFIGNIGSGEKMQFTVIGDSVNRAARYETATKTLGVDVAMGAAFRDRLSPEQRDRLSAHENVPLQNIPQAETIYGLRVNSSEA